MLIDYYQGAYGPTIRFDTQSIDSLMSIMNVVSALKDCRVQQYNIRQWEGIAISGLTDLTMKVIQGERVRKVKITGNTPDGPVFIWSMTPDEWYHCEGLIDGIIQNDRPGHQYLYEDKIIIELAYRELIQSQEYDKGGL